MNFKQFVQTNYKSQENIAKMYINNPCYGTQTSYYTARNLAVSVVENEVDVYMSMNPIAYKKGKINRDIAHLSKLKWLYCDLDYYNSQYNYMTKKQMLYFLQEDYFESKIPYPTLIVDSGRGIYLLWKLEEHKKALPRWMKMQKYIFNELKELGADPLVTTDSARVLRQIGSLNSKTGTKVEIIEQNEKKYSLSSLIHKFMPEEDTATEKMLSYASWIADTLNIEHPGDEKSTVRKFIKQNQKLATENIEATENMLLYAKSISELLEIDLPESTRMNVVKSYIETNKDAANLVYKMKSVRNGTYKNTKIVNIQNDFTLYKSRMKDLEILLLKHRDKVGGYRETILFLYRYYNLCITDSKVESLQNTLELNRKLHNSLEEKEVINATSSAEKYYNQGKIYRRTNKHVINMLGITKKEMKDLSVFVTKDILKERKKIKNRNNYLNKLEEKGKITKAEQKNIRKKAIYELVVEGKTQVEICKILNISKSTFYSDKSEIDFTSISDAQKIEPKAENKIRVDDSPKNSAIDINKSFRTLTFSPAHEDNDSIELFRLEYNTS